MPEYNEDVIKCKDCADYKNGGCEFMGGAKIDDDEAEFEWICMYFAPKQ